MKNNLYILLAMLTLSSCVIEDYPDNGWCEDRYVVVKSYDVDNNDITAQEVVSDVVLYIFDANDKLIKIVMGNQNQQLVVPNLQDSIQVVAWGNIQNSAFITKAVLGESISQAMVMLKTDGQMGDVTLAKWPSDLFWGVKKMGFNQTNVIVPITRKTSSINIVARNLQEWASALATDKFTFVVNRTKSIALFDGKFTGPDVSYAANSTTNAQNEITTGTFRTYPSYSEPITIDILKNGTKIHTVYVDDAGASIFLPTARQVNVILTFGNSGDTVGVTIEVVDWDNKFIDQDF